MLARLAWQPDSNNSLSVCTERLACAAACAPSFPSSSSRPLSQAYPRSINGNQISSSGDGHDFKSSMMHVPGAQVAEGPVGATPWPWMMQSMAAECWSRLDKWHSQAPARRIHKLQMLIQLRLQAPVKSCSACTAKKTSHSQSDRKGVANWQNAAR